MCRKWGGRPSEYAGLGGVAGFMFDSHVLDIGVPEEKRIEEMQARMAAARGRSMTR